MATQLNLQMKTGKNDTVFIDQHSNHQVRILINDGQVIIGTPMDIHEVDMLIAMLQAAKAKLRQLRAKEGGAQ